MDFHRIAKNYSDRVMCNTLIKPHHISPETRPRHPVPARDPQGGSGEVPQDDATVRVHPHQVLLLCALEASRSAHKPTVEITQNTVDKRSL